MSETYQKSFRIVCPEHYVPLVENLLQAEGFEFAPEPFSPLCRVLINGPKTLGASLAAFFGLIYIQDRSSMLPPLALDPPSGAGVLDMCASPGSKTGFLAQLTGRSGFVIGNEPTISRLATLRRNLHVLNLPQAVCSSGQGQYLAFANNSFDYILLDPPCSGWGTEKKHPGIKELWKGDKIQPLAALQRTLLKKAAELLRPGGRMVYSTCTTNHAENEEQLAYATSELPLKLLPAPRFCGFEYDTPRLGFDQALRVNGESSKAQGFFIACLVKDGGAQDSGQDSVYPTHRPARASQAIKNNFLPLMDEISAEQIADSAFNLNLLPRGRIFARGDSCFFVPEGVLGILPEKLEWHGFLLGKYKNGRGRISGRMRALLPEAPDEHSVNFDDIAPVRALITGQSVQCGLPSGEAALYWRGLPLGAVQVKNGRLIWNTK